MNEVELIFACAVTSAETESQACLLAESIRAHAGRFSDSAFWLMVWTGAAPLSDRAESIFSRLKVRMIPFEIEADAQKMPFAGKVFASAVAERLTNGRADLLVWLDPDAIIFREPSALILAPGKELGCRPVDHILIGSPYEQPADRFWRTVYQACDVPDERLFPMTTSADLVTIRPYVNAGMLVVRPEAGLLRGWRDRFWRVTSAGIFEPFLAEDMRAKIFLHQAILAGVILSTLTQEQIQILSHLVNYPLHMHHQIPIERRPARMNDLISGRHDTFFNDPQWSRRFPSDEPLHGWLERQLAACGLADS